MCGWEVGFPLVQFNSTKFPFHVFLKISIPYIKLPIHNFQRYCSNIQPFQELTGRTSSISRHTPFSIFAIYEIRNFQKFEFPNIFFDVSRINLSIFVDPESRIIVYRVLPLFTGPEDHKTFWCVESEHFNLVLNSENLCMEILGFLIFKIILRNLPADPTTQIRFFLVTVLLA